MEDPEEAMDPEYEIGELLSCKWIRLQVAGGYLLVPHEEYNRCLLDSCDTFERLSHGNTTVQKVTIQLFELEDRPLNVWETFGRALGNLKGLELLSILAHDDEDDAVEAADVDEDDLWVPNWEALRGILRHIRHPIRLDTGVIDFDARATGDDSFRSVVQGNRYIESFECTHVREGQIENAMATMMTLPALKHAVFQYSTEGGAITTFQGHQALHQLLLQSPTLRSVRFAGVEFPRQVSASMVRALEADSPIQQVEMYECNYRHVSHAVAMLLGLLGSITVETFHFSDNEFDSQDSFQDALLRVLHAKTFLKNLKIAATERRSDGTWLGPLFRCMATSNRTLQSLEVGDLNVSDEPVRAALVDMLSKNPVLEKLTLFSPDLPTNADLVHWREILMSLRTNNKALKSLTILLGGCYSKCLFPSLLIGMLQALPQSDSLERLVIASPKRDKHDDDFTVVYAVVIPAPQSLSIESYVAVLKTLLTHRMTLKELVLCADFSSISDEEMGQLVPLLVQLVTQNPCLQHLDAGAEELGEGVAMMLKLNRAGRRYLVQDAAAVVAKGVAVLARVSDDLDCVFTHLLENPSLCENDEKEIGHGRKRAREGIDCSFD